MKIQSDFLLLDIKHGRQQIYNWFRTKSGAPKPHTKKIPVTIHGYISDVWGHDDGVSREFEVIVTSVKCHKPRAIKGAHYG